MNLDKQTNPIQLSKRSYKKRERTGDNERKSEKRQVKEAKRKAKRVTAWKRERRGDADLMEDLMTALAKEGLLEHSNSESDFRTRIGPSRTFPIFFTGVLFSQFKV